MTEPTRQDLILEQTVQAIMYPLTGGDDLSRLTEAAGSARYVLLGEASHGTSEFYTVRSDLTRRLITEHGFRFIAVEGDWPSCFSVNRYIKNKPGCATSAEEALEAFDRWPEWMWANRETAELVEWLRAYNLKRPAAQQVGFYGLDVYSLWESLDEIADYFKRSGTKRMDEIRQALACFGQFGRDAQSYGLSASLFKEGCEEEVVRLLASLRTKQNYAADPEEEALQAEINALVSLHAERYYKTMITDDVESWNIRDRHMVEVLRRVADFLGGEARGIVWAHNTHIGDARATDMRAEGMVNVGQLLREQEPEHNVYAIGFGTHRGTVTAAYGWGETAQVMEVPEALPGTWEDLLHRTAAGDAIIMLRDAGTPLWETTLGHRAIGVVYHPLHEAGNYVPTQLPARYDAFVHLERTQAVQALEAEPEPAYV